MRNRQREQLFYFFAAQRCSAVHRRRSPIVSDQNRLALAERIDERDRIASEGLLVGIAIGNFGWTIAAHERRDDAISLGCNLRADGVPRVWRVGKAVKEQHG